MPRCDAYYRLENRRCSHEGANAVFASDTELYSVCANHAAEVWTTTVVHWNGETDLRRTTPVELTARTSSPVREAAFA
jgi:hypothetical protein